GIENQGGAAVLTVTESLIRANRAYTTYFGGQGNGGGLDNFGGQAVLSNVTISANFAVIGGGIENDTGRVTLTNATLSGNTASSGGGFDSYHARSTLSFVTLSGNTGTTSGGGLRQTGSVAGQGITLTATIMNAGAQGANCVVAGSGVYSITSSNYNLSSDASCSAYLLKPQDLNSTNPLLGPLQNNGGFTPTHLPGALSPAIDSAGGACPATDQRGFLRPSGLNCDRGSVEVVSAAAFFKLFLPLLLR
ncbi:MAG: choice-of-anchor Q domain-containing protein, partial [Anaerolineales bacterium]